jgi:hypothetical protein
VIWTKDHGAINLRRMKPIGLLVALLVLVAPGSARSATVKDREGAVRKDRESLATDTRWVYNDFQSGLRAAKSSGKPLLVVLRCVPCLACAGIDAAVLLEQSELAPLLDQFVCVRIINANSLDLKLFQFDYDLSFSILFFNADGIVYGRYSSWKHQKDPQDQSSTGLKRTLEAALALHREYPGNKAALAGKQGDILPFATPVEMPGLSIKYKPELDWEGKVVQSCVHCHQIGEALREQLRADNKTLPAQLIYPWPEPEIIGLSLAQDELLKVASVAPGSAADKAGIKSGDEILSLAGQTLISAADMSWVLHHAPENGSLAAMVKSSGVARKVTVLLPTGWREKTDISRRSGTWGLRGMATGGLVLEDLSDEIRNERKIGSGQMALLVKFVGQYGKHAAAKNAGFAKDDVITELDGKSNRLTESQVLGYLLQNYKQGKVVKASVLRGEQRLELSLPVQ